MAALVREFKADPRGPFQAIRWFCPDGSVLPPQERCAEPGGLQHALVKESVSALARDRGIHLGQILAGTPDAEFWDPADGFSRAKQYALERYLVAVDDGWILRRARFYRGAFQVEDEEAWGRGFLSRLLDDDAVVRDRFFLVRQLARWIPHRPVDDRWQRIRATALAAAEADPRFTDLRVKIHGQPEASDLAAVTAFRGRADAARSAAADSMLAVLEQDLAAEYAEPADAALAALRGRMSGSVELAERLDAVLAALDADAPAAAGRELSELLLAVRRRIIAPASGDDRLVLLDLSLDVERVLFRQVGTWRARDLRGLAARAELLARGAAGAGFLELWELESVLPRLDVGAEDDMVHPVELAELAATCDRVAAWCAGLASATFDPAIRRFGFEPLAAGYVDDCLRGSVVLALGEAAERLARAAAVRSGVRSRLMDMPAAGGARGVNPGLAEGLLEVQADPADPVTFAPDRICVLARPPANLTPVAGLLTLSEGNPVSHVQLLARNLGIPNVVLAAPHLEALRGHAGERVFLAVSPRGTVVLKPVAELTVAERELVVRETREPDLMHVPVDRVDLDATGPVDLRWLRAADSGRLCGPKAANLGQLKALFPEHVADGLVIPFGVFRAHLNQSRPQGGGTYRQWLHDAYARAEARRRAGEADDAVERELLADLARFREMIESMPFLPGFTADLRSGFESALGGPPEDVPVFVRSDTNMEDLRDFTGAGLNLTLPNVQGERALLDGIRAVWASPYSERSYRWRQRILANPEDVYPSILLQASVAVDRSGVMITGGVAGGASGDLTVAFNRGVSGAVEGQAAESWLLRADGRDELLAPSRESQHMVLSAGGGVARQAKPFSAPVLTTDERETLRRLGGLLQQRLAGIVDGALDVELGLRGGEAWLFQVRPFVQNRRSQGSSYLRGLDEAADAGAPVSWATPLEDLEPGGDERPGTEVEE
ncbi:MAG TPA: PEP/pyruvate-binding domain-containing protein [Candidatus Krumholzibacteria bacterium]|nr:PEP/pyruvate-binding domain-containing protein [Candidatus Krumholzibacteria bacterium]